MLQRILRGIPAAATAFALVFGLSMITAGCGGDASHRPLTEQDKQNIDDELKASEDQKKNKEKTVRPTA